jgi:raffinose/stachyose/melibiose transport system substrate-binding protein
MHKASKVAVAAASCLLLVSACTGQTSSSAKDGETKSGSLKGTTIKWLIEAPEDAAALKALKLHVADFTKQSGIKVNVSTLPFETMRTVLQTQLRSGDGPDVFNWGSGPSFGGALAKAGLVADLTDAYAKGKWQVFDFAKERVTLDGKLYSIPGEMETIGLFYNKKIFTDLGLSAPTSLSDLQAASAKIRAAGKIPMAVGDKEGWEGGHFLSMALSSLVGSKTMEGLLNGTTSWDSPQVIASLKVWKDFNKAGYLPKSPTSVGYDSSTSLFYSGKAAMVPTGSWLVGEIDDNVKSKFEVGYVPFPAPDGPGIFTGGLGSGPWVSATTKKKAAAIKFLDFLASPEHGKWTVENLHTIPPMPLDTANLKVSPLFARVLKDTASISTGSGFGYNIDVLETDKFNKAMTDGVQAIFTGQKSPEDVAKSLQAAQE